MKEPAKLFQMLIKNVLTLDGSNPEMTQHYTNDFLRMTFPGQALSVYEVNGVWCNTSFKWCRVESEGYRICSSKNWGKKLASYVLHTSQQLLVLSLNSTLRKGFF